jgi:hypothetical protein
LVAKPAPARSGSVAAHGDDAAILNSERQLSVFQSQGIVAK